MRRTTTYSRGDIVVVNFVFADESGVKRCPVVVASTADYHQGRHEAVVSAVTSNTVRVLIGDYLIADWESAGLVYPSICTGIVRTINQSLIEHRLGSVSPRDLAAIDGNLKLILGLAV